MKGSKPITCVPRDSRSCSERTCTPITVLAIEAIIDEARVYLRRDARSLKKEFQSSLEASARDAFAAVELRRKAVLRRMGERQMAFV
jgi:CRP-like cAMP-binding protein